MGHGQDDKFSEAIQRLAALLIEVESANHLIEHLFVALVGLPSIVIGTGDHNSIAVIETDDVAIAGNPFGN